MFRVLQTLRFPIMPTELPQGRYLSLAFKVSADAGGQTRALLMRNRIFASEGGVRPDVLTLGQGADIAERRELLRDRGLLAGGVGLLNIYEHFREHGWGDQAPTGEELEDLSRYRIREEHGPDGTPWRAVHRLPDTRRPVVDYLRADGSTYLRMPAFSLNYKSWWRGAIQLAGADGAVVGGYDTPGQWFRRWIRDLVGEDDRAFIFIDSRYVVPHVVPMRGRRFHLIYLMHNVHVRPPRRWDSETNVVYKRVLARIGGLDAMVTLTDRQREDIARRCGRTSNLFVVPNPVNVPEPPAREPARDPCQVTIVARLEPQKNLSDAIAAFAHVVREVPGARLDIYGGGSQAGRLEQRVKRLGLAGSVTLRGYDPQAPERLWTSSAFLMTSSFEGYPLSTLESMSRGCPVVSYDIKYGPREQITDGEDGFLVPKGDTALLARRVIELLRAPELVRRMSAAARARAESYGPAEFIARWADVVQATVELQPLRTRIDDVSLEIQRLRLVSASRLGRLLGRGRKPALGAVAADQALELAAELTIDGHSRKTGLDAVELGLAWIDRKSGAVDELPLDVKLNGERFRLRAVIGLPARAARLRLLLTWRNSAWQTELVRFADGALSLPPEQGKRRPRVPGSSRDPDRQGSA
jgi:poly(glycerol-phosphate) alpha-glucosyltransferase